jgi:hypothetical protein
MSTARTKASGGARIGERLLRGGAIALGGLALFAATAQGGINGGGRARGVITAFGSIFVNGVEYDIAGATITVNGVATTEDKLRVGQVVTVDGVVNNDLVTGQAATVAHESDVRGAVTAVDESTSSLRVLGQSIRVNGGTKFSAGFAPANLAGVDVGDIVEISGYRTAGGALVATRVQVSPSSHDRIVGQVSELDEGNLTFRIGSLRVNYAHASLIEGDLANGALVEVEGPRASGLTLIARKVNVEDGGLGGEPGDGGSIEGLVTSPLDAGFFAINGQVIIIKSTTVFEDGGRADLVNNARVEAEGRFDSKGRILAEKVKIEHEDDAYVFSTIESIDLATQSLGLVGLRVYIKPATELDDNSNANDPNLTFNDLEVGDTIEIDGYEARLKRRVVVQKLVRQDPENRTRIGGRVSSVEAGRFVVLDLTVVTNSGTVYLDQLENPISRAKFFATAANREVKVRGDWNGTRFVAEEVELEN